MQSEEIPCAVIEAELGTFVTRENSLRRRKVFQRAPSTFFPSHARNFPPISGAPAPFSHIFHRSDKPHAIRRVTLMKHNRAEMQNIASDRSVGCVFPAVISVTKELYPKCSLLQQRTTNFVRCDLCGIIRRCKADGSSIALRRSRRLRCRAIHALIDDVAIARRLSFPSRIAPVETRARYPKLSQRLDRKPDVTLVFSFGSRL